jgi:hypothetical protein
VLRKNPGPDFIKLSGAPEGRGFSPAAKRAPTFSITGFFSSLVDLSDPFLIQWTRIHLEMGERQAEMKPILGSLKK